MAEKETPILGTPVAGKVKAEAFMEKMAPKWSFLVGIYYSLAPYYNVRADVALAQACKETGYFQFRGAVQPDFNNFCGLKRADAAGDSPADHARFATPEEGVEAHIQHLYCYATVDPLPPDHKLVDPRFELVSEFVGRGTAPTVEKLGGVWAPDVDYGRSIVHDYLAKLISFTLPEKEERQKLARQVEELDKENHRLTRVIEELEQKLNGKAGEVAKLQGELDSCKVKIKELKSSLSEMAGKLKEIAAIVLPYK